MAWAGPAPSMVTLIPRKGLQSPSVRTIFLRASYTLLYWALGSGCRLCIRVCNKAHEGEASVTQLSTTNPTVQSYHNSKIIEGSVQLLDVPYLSYFLFLSWFFFIYPDGWSPCSHCDTQAVPGGKSNLCSALSMESPRNEAAVAAPKAE